MGDIIAHGLRFVIVGGMVVAGIKGLRDTLFRQ
jgi:hypothetical protein